MKVFVVTTKSRLYGVRPRLFTCGVCAHSCYNENRKRDSICRIEEFELDFAQAGGLCGQHEAERIALERKENQLREATDKLKELIDSGEFLALVRKVFNA
jgi:hypothetical protein